MKVLLFPHSFYPAKEGGSTTFTNLALGLKENRQEVEILTSTSPSSDFFFIKSCQLFIAGKNQVKGLTISRLNTVKTNQRFLVNLAKLSNIKFLAIVAKGPIFKNLKKILKKRQIDWVIAGHLPLLTPFWALLVAKRNKAKLGIIPGFHPNEKDHQNKCFVWLLKKVDGIFCATKYEKDVYKKLGINPDKIFVFGGLISDQIFDHNPSKKAKFPKTTHLLYLGSKAAHKRINLLVTAFVNLLEKGFDLKLTIAGPETLSSLNLEQKINKLPFKIKQKIIYLKEVSQEKKIDLIDSATVLVNPSEHESFGNVFVESWARKKPVIAANLPALKENIGHKINGLLFEKNSILDLQKQIEFIVKNQNWAKEMGKKGYEKAVRRFKRKTVAQKIIAKIKQLDD